MNMRAIAVFIGAMLAMTCLGCASGHAAPSFMKFTPDSSCLVFDDDALGACVYCIPSGKLYRTQGFFDGEDEAGKRWIIHEYGRVDTYTLVSLTTDGAFDERKLPEPPLNPHYIAFGPGGGELTMLENYVGREPRACRLDIAAGKYAPVEDKQELDRLKQLEEREKQRSIPGSLANTNAMEISHCGKEMKVEKKLLSPDGKHEVTVRVEYRPGVSTSRVYGDCRVEVKDLATGETRTVVRNEKQSGDEVFDVTLGPVIGAGGGVLWFLGGCRTE